MVETPATKKKKVWDCRNKTASSLSYRKAQNQKELANDKIFIKLNKVG